MGWWETVKEKVQEYEEAGKENLQEGQDYLVKEYEQGKEYVEEKKQEINAALKEFDDSRAQQAQNETPTVIGAAHVPIDSEGRDHEFNSNVKEDVAAAATAVDAAATGIQNFDNARALQAQSEAPSVIGAAHVPIDSEGRDHEFTSNVKEGVSAAAAAVDAAATGVQNFDKARAQQAQSETPTVIGAAHVPLDENGRDHEYHENARAGTEFARKIAADMVIGGTIMIDTACERYEQNQQAFAERRAIQESSVKDASYYLNNADPRIRHLSGDPRVQAEVQADRKAATTAARLAELAKLPLFALAVAGSDGALLAVTPLVMDGMGRSYADKRQAGEGGLRAAGEVLWENSVGPVVQKGVDLQSGKLGQEFREHPLLTGVDTGLAVGGAYYSVRGAYRFGTAVGAYSRSNSFDCGAPSSQWLTNDGLYLKGPDGQVDANFNLKQRAFDSQGMTKVDLRYPGHDEMSLSILPPGTKLARLEPGADYFFRLDEQGRALLDSRDATRISEACQVNPHVKYGYRDKLSLWEVTAELPVTQGRAQANAQYGAGGITQVHLPGTSKEGHCLEQVGVLKQIKEIKLQNNRVSEERFTNISDKKKLEIDRARTEEVYRLYSPRDIAARNLHEPPTMSDEPLLVRQQAPYVKADAKRYTDLLNQVPGGNNVVLRAESTPSGWLNQKKDVAGQSLEMALKRSDVEMMAGNVLQRGERTPARVSELRSVLIEEGQRLDAAMKPLQQRCEALRGMPLSGAQVGELAITAYCDGRNRELEQDVSAIAGERKRLDARERDLERYASDNGLDAAHWQLLPNWLKGDGLRYYEANQAAIAQERQRLDEREAANRQEAATLRERCETQGQPEIRALAAELTRRDEQRQAELQTTQKELEQLRDARREVSRLDLQLLRQPTERLLQLAGDPRDSANLLAQSSSLQLQLQLPQAEQGMALSR